MEDGNEDDGEETEDGEEKRDAAIHSNFYGVIV
jgi:hypothetical protein